MMQNSQQFSEDFLNCIKTIDNIPCFVKINDSNHIVIAIHEHLGLVENFTTMLSEFVQNYASIIIPDLFCNIQVENIDPEDEFAFLKQLVLNQVHLIIRKCISYAQAKKKMIILMGFSIGASLGLKLIENCQEISLGMFFYGYPKAKNLNPQKISCPIVIFHAQKDKVRHLSDNDQFKLMIKAYENQENVQIQQINSLHGFMNHLHPNYDEKSFKYCRKLFLQYLIEIEKNDGKLQKRAQIEMTNKKDEAGACIIY